jgi:hypothetical protein
MAITLASIYEMTLPGLRAIEGRYPGMKNEWGPMYAQGTSKMAVERTLENRYLPVASLRTEGGATTMDNQSGARWVFNHKHFEIALGYAITLRAIEDNLYETQFPASNLGLQESFSQTKDIYGADIFNRGNIYDPSVGGDGVALFSPNHPIDGGSFGKMPVTQVDLNEASLLTGLTAIKNNFRTQSGLRTPIMGNSLTVPLQLEWVGKRLLNADLRPGTSDNDPNVIKGTLPGGLHVWRYLTNPKAWFIRTDYKDGLIYLQRAPYEMSTDVDFATDNLLVKARERYFFGEANPRGVWGSFPV